ncbi:MAG: M48 family metalloprotease, partial [Nitrospinota bacterium]
MEREPITPEHCARARRYQMRRLRLEVAASALEFGAVAALLALAPRGGWPSPGGGNFLAGALFFALMTLLRQAASLHLDYLAGFRLAHQVGLSNETLAGWLRDRAKGLLLVLLIGCPAGGGLVAIMARWPGAWWWIGASLGILLGGGLALIRPVLLAPLFFRFKPLADPGLRGRLESLLRRTGARVRGGVWEMDLSRKSRAANAALVGWGPSRRVVLSDTLLEYAPDEIEAILAHEIAHHVGRHIPRLMMARAAVFAAGMFLAQAVLEHPRWYAWSGLPPLAAGEPAALAALWLLFGIGGAALSPLLLAYARGLEHWCDAFAVKHTGGGQGMASALEKLCLKNLADPFPPGWVVALFHSHPPLGERIRR